MSKPRSLDLDAEMRRKAGISVEAARARDVFPYDTDSDVPLGSALAAAERRREEEDGREAVVRRIRQVYFGVADRDLRRALTRGSRDMHDLRFRVSGAAVDEGRRPAAERIQRGAFSVEGSRQRHHVGGLAVCGVPLRRHGRGDRAPNRRGGPRSRGDRPPHR